MAWIGINSTHYDSHTGDDGEHTIEEALNGTNYWANEAGDNYFTIDLGQQYNIQKLRGRSNLDQDPIVIEIYTSNDGENWDDLLVDEDSIETWQDTDDWVEVDCPSVNARYVGVEILETEDGIDGAIKWGGDPAFTIFDVDVESIFGRRSYRRNRY